MIDFKGIRIKETGTIDVLKLENLSFNSIPESSVLIKNTYSGINFIDIYHRSGLYRRELPFTPGMEGGGKVIEIGANISDTEIGDRVVYLGAFGSYSEYTIVPQQNIIRVPDGLSLKIAVASLLQGLTAEFLTDFIYPLKKGDTCLIHAAAGGVGLLLVQMAKLRGARVIGTVGDQQKVSYVMNAGADHVVVYSDYDFEDEIIDLTNREGVDVVYDSVGKETFDQSLNCLKRFGLMVSYGNSSGLPPSISPQELQKKGSLFLTRPTLLQYIEDPVRLKSSAETLFDYLLKGKLKTNIELEVPLNEASEAQRILESRKTHGKILLKMDE